jgi:hypothetical protein
MQITEIYFETQSLSFVASFRIRDFRSNDVNLSYEAIF